MSLKTFGARFVEIAKANGLDFSEPADLEQSTIDGMDRLAQAFEVDTAPSPTSTGSPGQMHLAGSTLYLCVAPDTWVRFTVTTSW